MDFTNQIINGDCIELTKQLPDSLLDAVLIDPPYGEHQRYKGDDGLREAKQGLQDFLQVVFPKVKQNGYIAVFWTMRNVDICIETVKHLFTFRRLVSMYVRAGSARPHLGWIPRTQAIIIAQKYFPGQPSHIDDFHDKLSVYLQEKMIEKGYSNPSLAKEMGCNSRLVSKWTRKGDKQRVIPTPKYYPKLKELLDIDDEYDFLLEREEAHKDQRRDFEYKPDCYMVNTKGPELLHPSQKPLDVIEHVVSCICPKEGLVLDAFCGSGTTAVASRNTGRNFICFDISSEYCEIARRRLAEL